jgi:V8-like Glu-specific endopeptidase
VFAAVAALWPAPPAVPVTISADALVSSTPGVRPSTPVGALFTTSAGHLGSHFCTASVIDSPAGNLLLTAAHCVAGYSRSAPAGLVFVPGYHDGSTPHGIWPVTRIFVDRAWAATADPDHDVAFLTVAQAAAAGTALENLTGAERLGIGQPSTDVVLVTGYPDGSDQAISCRNRTSAFGPTQLRFDCGGFTDGTSGSPFLTDVDAATGAGTVIGVIGGYQQGGDTADVSYSATFGASVQALYETAVSQR